MRHSLGSSALSGGEEESRTGSQVLEGLQTDSLLLQEETATSTARVKEQGWGDPHRNYKRNYKSLLPPLHLHSLSRPLG